MSKSNRQKKDKDFAVFRIKHSQLGRFSEYNRLIDLSLDENNYIPKDLFVKFINFLFGIDDDRKEEYDILIDSIKKDLLAFIKKNQKYDFDFSFEMEELTYDIPNKKGISKQSTVKRVLSFDDMITEALKGSLWIYPTSTTKLQFIRNCYEIMDRYTKLDKRLRKKYSHRKLTIVTSYITFKLGVFKLPEALRESLDNKVEPTTNELYHWLDDSFKKVRTYPSPKK